MVGVLILTHGNLARELLASASAIAGDLETFEALPLSWTDGIDRVHEQVGAAVDRLETGSGVLILVDIFGGTPCNVAMAFRDPGRVEVIAGVNLPMIVRLACLKSSDMPVAEMATWIRDKAKTSILCSSDLPRPSGNSASASEARPQPCDDAEAPPAPAEATEGARKTRSAATDG